MIYISMALELLVLDIYNFNGSRKIQVLGKYLFCFPWLQKAASSWSVFLLPWKVQVLGSMVTESCKIIVRSDQCFAGCKIIVFPWNLKATNSLSLFPWMSTIVTCIVTYVSVDKIMP